ncbi:MAG: hypothetical protein R2942_12310 [Ignavibacteria bacterium]
MDPTKESVFWRRNLWLKAGSKINIPELKYAGDYELWLRFFRFAKLYSVETIFAVSADSEQKISFHWIKWIRMCIGKLIWSPISLRTPARR